MIQAKKLTKSLERLEPTELHRDMLGRGLKEGQYVAISGSRMSIAQIKRFTPKMVSVDIIGQKWGSTHLKFPMEIVIVDSEDVVMWVLANGL